MAKKEVAAYGGVEIDGGVFFDGNFKQLGIQIVEVIVGFLWSFIGSFLIIALIDCVPGLEVLDIDKHIAAGLDTNQTEESLFDFSYPDEVDYAPVDRGIIEL